MKVKVLNASSKKTRENIKKTFANLLKEKGLIEKITVTELVKRADITRSSFYTHYDNVYDVAREIQEENIDVVLKSINAVYTTKDIYKTFDTIFEYIKEQEEIYSSILSSDEPLLFTKKINKIASENIKLLFKNYKNDNLDLMIDFYTAGSINLIIKYFKNETDKTLDEINAYIKEAFKNIFESLKKH